MKKKLIAIIAALSILLALLVGCVIFMEWNSHSEESGDTEGSTGRPVDQTTETTGGTQATDEPTEHLTEAPATEPAGETTKPVDEETTAPPADVTTEPTETTEATEPEDTTPEITFPENDTQPAPPATDATDATDATGDTEDDPKEDTTPELEL